MTRHATTFDETEMPALLDALIERFGITTPANRYRHVARAAEEVLKRHRCPSLGKLTATVRTEGTDSPMVQELLDAVTVNESYFFRDTRLMAALKTHILPTLIARRAQQKTIRIWSAGCSAGQEAYSVAIILRELLRCESWTIEILGTDIDSGALERAWSAKYTDNSLRACADPVRKRYFVASAGKRWVLRSHYRDGVRFQPDNLLDPILKNVRAPFDLVICRNVTIYFDEEGIRKAQEKVARYLAPDGLAVFGVLEYRNSAGLVAVPGVPMAMPVFTPSSADADDTSEPTRERDATSSERPTEKPEPVLNARARLSSALATGAGRVRGLTRREVSAEVTQASLARGEAELEQTLTRARVLADKGRATETLAILMGVIDKYPCDPRAYYLAAIVQQDLGALEGAELMLRQTLYLEPEFEDAPMRHAMVKRSLRARLGASGAEAEAARLRPAPAGARLGAL